MSGIFVHMTWLVALVVFGIVLAGFWNLTRRDSNPNLSQKLMRWRVGLQFVAILIAMLALALLKSEHP